MVHITMMSLWRDEEYTDKNGFEFSLFFTGSGSDFSKLMEPIVHFDSVQCSGSGPRIFPQFGSGSGSVWIRVRFSLDSGQVQFGSGSTRLIQIIKTD